VSSFVWRHVDYTLGAIELFEDTNFKKNRATIFISEWAPDQIHSIANWYLKKKISSIRWSALDDRINVTMYQNADGTGGKYDNVHGTSHQKEIANLNNVRFNDMISAFSWNSISPKKEIVKNIILSKSVDTFLGGLIAKEQGKNESGEKLVVVLTLNDTSNHSITVETMDQKTFGIKVTIGEKQTSGPEILKNEIQLSVEASFQYQLTGKVSRTATVGSFVGISQTATVSPYSAYEAVLVAQIGQVTDKEYSTTATRWYEQAVRGGVPDPTNHGWYKRDEHVVLRISGAYALNWQIHVKETPLDRPKPT